MSYSKLHASLVYSSLWSEPDHVRILFITLLAMADKDGYVYGSKSGIERAAMILVNDDDVDPWHVLMSPDPDSSDRMRAPENEGRRIEEVPGGFRLLNFTYYRGLRNDDDRREQNRIAQARYKAKVSQGKPPVSHANPSSSTISPDKPPKAHTEAEAEAEAIKGASAPVGRADGLTAQNFFDRWNALAAKHPKLAACRKLTDHRRKKIATRLKSSDWFENFIEAVKVLPLGGDKWQPTLDWFIENDDNVYRVLEGSFDFRLSDDPAAKKLERERRKRAAAERDAVLEREKSTEAETTAKTHAALQAIAAAGENGSPLLKKA